MTQEQEKPAEETTGTEEKTVSRRAALAKLGLFGAAIYAAPALLTLGDAEARSRSRSKSNNKKRRKKKQNKKKSAKRSRSNSRSRSRSRSK
jgi:hypothetical protein